MGISWWQCELSTVSSPQCGKHTFRVTLFLDLSVLTQEFINICAPNIFPASSLECQQFTTKMSLDWTLCVCVRRCASRDTFRKDLLTARFLYLEHQIANDIETLVFLQHGRTWALIKLVVFLKTPWLARLTKGNRLLLTNRFYSILWPAEFHPDRLCII